MYIDMVPIGSRCLLNGGAYRETGEEADHQGAGDENDLPNPHIQPGNR
jgi:hypothetical protein